jgi:hypothetical protein
MAATVTNKIFIRVEIKSRLNVGKSYYCSVQCLLSSCILSKTPKNFNNFT